jgi:hypothetical protein
MPVDRMTAESYKHVIHSSFQCWRQRGRAAWWVPSQYWISAVIASERKLGEKPFYLILVLLMLKI